MHVYGSRAGVWPASYLDTLRYILRTCPKYLTFLVRLVDNPILSGGRWKRCAWKLLIALEYTICCQPL